MAISERVASAAAVATILVRAGSFPVEPETSFPTVQPNSTPFRTTISSCSRETAFSPAIQTAVPTPLQPHRPLNLSPSQCIGQLRHARNSPPHDSNLNLHREHHFLSKSSRSSRDDLKRQTIQGIYLCLRYLARDRRRH